MTPSQLPVFSSKPTVRISNGRLSLATFANAPSKPDRSYSSANCKVK